MKKIETIWHHLLFNALEKKQFKYTQEQIAREYAYSLSTVNHALRVPSEIGSIRKESKFFVLQDFKKLLYYWASVRNFQKDVIFKTYSAERILEIEGLMPDYIIYACYSAVRLKYKEPPSDYDHIYVYIEEKRLDDFKKRFEDKDNKTITRSNISVIKMPHVMRKFGKITTLPQTFVDIWNLPDWYSKDFTNFLESKINELL